MVPFFLYICFVYKIFFMKKIENNYYRYTVIYFIDLIFIPIYKYIMTYE